MKTAILMGSDSDWPILKPAAEVLKRFGIEPVVQVASAHRTPDKVRNFVAEAVKDGVGVFIVAAGAAAHLAGVVASYTTSPVIGVPIKCYSPERHGCTAFHGADALRRASCHHGSEWCKKCCYTCSRDFLRGRPCPPAEAG